MKTLFLIRHAKSSWSDPSLKDFDRPLNSRGERDAPMMAKLLHKTNPDIDIFLSSPANRALTTAIIIAKEFDLSEKDIIKNDNLYHASPSRILQVIAEQDDSLDSLAVFAHNPGLTDLANQLCSTRIDNLPTTGIFVVQFNVKTWAEIKNTTGDFLFFDYPKKHKG